ncbi:hypothetical protein [Parapedobacter sp. DT-150]|uniref:hypothetical protein n=1 Tax=Parapedobacter sp. DT-150 TaxID=3396162 RepID=UPI003F1DF3E0
MTLKQIYPVKNNQLVITLPASFGNKKKVMVTVNEVPDALEKKYRLMRKAASDALLQQDIKEVADDFDDIDSETV